MLTLVGIVMFGSYFANAKLANPPYGEKKVLIVKISTLDIAYDDYTNMSLWEVFEPYYYFDNPTPRISRPHLASNLSSYWFENVATQLRACSFNQIDLKPADGSPLIQGGVLDITIPMNLVDEDFPIDTSYKFYDVRNLAHTTTRETL